MAIHNVTQGSPEWAALRAQHFTASEAPAMMGCSPYMTRTELLIQKKTGLAAEVDAATQRRFDEGHAAEANYRAIVEQETGLEFYPATISQIIEGLPLLASMDGLTMDGSIGFEHKLYNRATVDAIASQGEPPMHHVWQLEHQALVAGVEQILFACTDGEEGSRCWYESKPERRAALIAGWKQFAADLAVYVPTLVEAKPAGKSPETLPALRIELTGQVTASNLAEFKETALAAIRSVNRNLQTDQDFADAEQAVKWCEEVESRIKAAKDAALAQTASIDALFKTLDDISAESRKVRLDVDKLVKARKDQIRMEKISAASDQLRDHLAKICTRLGVTGMTCPADFAGVIKGKRSLASIQDALDTELARAKIAANELADRVEANIKSLKGEAHDWTFLFPDLIQVATKSAEDFSNLLAARISAHNQAEAARRQREEAARQVAKAVQQQAPVAAVPAPAQVVTAAPAVATTDSGATLKLGEINARLHPISITREGLETLGFKPKTIIKNALLYRESDFPAICTALINHIQGAAAQTKEAA